MRATPRPPLGFAVLASAALALAAPPAGAAPQLSFDRVDAAVGTPATAIQARDLNGDGRRDVAAASGEGAGSLATWHGLGDGSFRGIVRLAPGGVRLTLARYNGSNHQHGDIRYQPHIHRATEAAITDGRKPEHAAEETTRYQTLEGALACLIEDFSLSGLRANPDHPSLFNGH